LHGRQHLVEITAPQSRDGEPEADLTLGNSLVWPEAD
jgi:hypothetical protein